MKEESWLRNCKESTNVSGKNKTLFEAWKSGIKQGIARLRDTTIYVNTYVQNRIKQGRSEGYDSCDRPSNITYIWIQIIEFSAFVTLKIDGWPRKAIGHLFHTTASFVHPFKAIRGLKLGLQSGNAQFWSKSEFLLFFGDYFTMIRWCEEGLTNAETDWTIHRSAWSQLK